MTNPPMENCPLPQPVSDSLSPYIKTRQEALKTRRTITIYLDSLVEYPEDGTNCLPPLSAASRAIGVKKIPPLLTGLPLRKEYLRAVQANVAVRREYDAITGKRSDERVERAAYGRGFPLRGGDEESVETYLGLLRERERLEKLQIYHHYLDKIVAKEAAGADYLHYEERGRVDGDLDAPPLRPSMAGAIAKNELEVLTERLEKSVLQARRRLERERELLGEVKARLGIEEGDGGMVGGGDRVAALQRTKDELIEWIEQQLAKSADGDDDGAVGDLREVEVDTRESRSQKMDRIKGQYADYIEARKSLLAAAAMATASPAGAKQEQDVTVSKTQTPAKQTSTGHDSTLPPVIDQVVRLSELHNSLTMLKSHHAESMAEGKLTMLQVLNRLSDESHLIPAHPAPAAERKPHSLGSAFQPSTAGDRKDMEISLHATAWSFASKAARAATKEHVSEKSKVAEENLKDAQEGMKRLRAVLGQKSMSTAEDGDEDDDEGDVWATEAGAQRHGKDRKLKGPFTGLKGDI